MARKVVEKNIAYDDIKEKYYVNLDYGKEESGKRNKHSPSFSKLSDARKVLKQFEADKVKGTLLKPKATTLKEWLESWMENNIKPYKEETTVHGYENIINKHIIPALGKMPIQKLSAQQIQKYYTTLLTEKHLLPSTVKKHHELLKTALNVAVKQDVLIKNPVDKVDAPKNTNREAKCYTTDELNMLLDLVKNDRLEIVVYLAAFAGLRREEISGLKWENVDFENRFMTIKEVKTMAGGEIINKKPKNDSSTRQLFIVDELLDALNREKNRQEENKAYLQSEYINSGLVVAWPNGKEYRPNYISELFTKFLKDNNLRKIVLHELRHTFASIANLSGASLYDISKALGHSTTSTTGKIYTHMFDNTKKDTMMKVSDSITKNRAGKEN
jgi:integrase